MSTSATALVAAETGSLAIPLLDVVIATVAIPTH